jgi:hypothetical protein
MGFSLTIRKVVDGIGRCGPEKDAQIVASDFGFDAPEINKAEL